MSEGVLQLRVWELEKALKATFKTEHEYVGKQIADIAFAKWEAGRLRTQLAASEEKLRVARAFIIEGYAMLRAHEDAIRADSGNTNWEVTADKFRAALKAIGEGE